jgi:limonene-1,2-epoxide hydrolase
MSDSPEAVVRRVLAAVESGDFGALDYLFSEDMTFQDPRFVRRGRDAVKKQLQEDLQSMSDLIFETTGIAANGRVVMTERVDRFTMNGKSHSLDTVGVFEMGDDGKVKRWREYFDLTQFKEG